MIQCSWMQVASTSETFAEFRKAAKEKADRERGLKEQQVVIFHSPLNLGLG